MQRPAPEALARVAEKNAENKNARSEDLALEILKLAVSHATALQLTADDALTNAEKMWQWVTTDSWPPEGK